MGKIIAWVAGVIIFLVLVGGIGYKIVAPTSKTVIGKGGKQIVLNTDKPQIPLGGCSIYKINVKGYWEKGFAINSPKEEKK